MERASSRPTVQLTDLPAQAACLLRIHLKNGSVVEMEQHGPFDFGLWLNVVRGVGAVMTPLVYIPWENIALILRLDSANQELQGIRVQQGRPN